MSGMKAREDCADVYWQSHGIRGSRRGACPDHDVSSESVNFILSCCFTLILTFGCVKGVSDA